MTEDLDFSKAETLIEALPYFKRFAGKTVVIKYGSSLLGSAESLAAFAYDIALLRYVGLLPVVVHGGGDEITKWTERLGKSPEFQGNVRVTDAETLEIAEMVVSGQVNNALVSAITRAGGRAIGISGKDSALLVAQRMHNASGDDWGFVGEIEAVDTNAIKPLIAAGYVPVVSSFAMSRTGESLLLRSDHVASRLASALQATKLIFLSNVGGVLRDQKILSVLDLFEARELLSVPNVVSGGMLAKLRDAVDAIKGGAGDVHILDGRKSHSLILELFTKGGVGTMITNDRVRV